MATGTRFALACCRCGRIASAIHQLEDCAMTPTKIAAQFAAQVWYTNTRSAPRAVVEKEARRFAKQHWQAFVPVAPEGLGKLLLAIARPRKRSRSRLRAVPAAITA